VVTSDWLVPGAQSVLVYATMYGSIVGWDLRAPGTAWKLENDLKRGEYNITEVGSISFAL
jgi:phosphoinositide-3-kinase regulatory subunit 4